MDKEAFDREQEGIKLTEKRAEQLNQINDIGRDYTGILLEQNKAAQEQLAVLNKINGTNVQQKNLTKANLDLASALAGLTKDDLKDRTKREALQKKINKANDEARQLQARLSKDLKEQADLRLKIQEAGAAATDDDKVKLAALEAQNQITSDQLDTLRMMSDEAQGFIGEMKKFKVGKAFHFFSDLVKDIPIISTVFADLTKGAEKFDEELAASGSTIKALGRGMLEFGKLTLKALAAFVVAKIIEGVKLLDASVIGLQRSLVQTGANASLAFGNIASAAAETGMTLDKMIPLNNALNDSLGTSAVFSKDTLASMSLLANKLGLSAEEAAKLYKETAGSGVSLDDFVGNIADATVEFNKANKSAIGIKTILSDVSHASAATSLSLKAFPGGIQKAALSARKLGLSLDKVEDTMSGMLDIENSIAKEMEAEILLGRDLNLDKARLAALNNDIEGFTKAIADQGITAADFTKMNRLEQEALAAALGMSRDELGGMLKTEKAMKTAKAEGDKEGQKQISSGDQLLEKLKGSVTVGEQFDMVMQQVAIQLGKIAVNLMPEIKRLLGELPGIATSFVTIMKEEIIPALEKVYEWLGQSTLGLDNWKIALGGIAAISFMGPIGSLRTMFGIVKGIGKMFSSKGAIAKAFGKEGIFGSGGKIAKAFSADSKLMKGLSSFTSSIGSAVKSVGGKVSNFFGGVGSKISGAFTAVKDTVGGVVKKLNPMNALKEGIKKAGGIGKVIGKVAKFPLIATALEGAFAYNDIQNLMASGLTGKELDSAIGKRAYDAIGTVIGSAGGSILGSILPVGGTLLGGLAGAFGGPYLARGIAQLFDSDYSKLGGVVSDLPFFKDSMPSTIQAEDFTIKTHPKDTLVMAGGTQFGEETNNLLRQLITAVQAGGDVYIDGNKAGNAMVLASSRFN